MPDASTPSRRPVRGILESLRRENNTLHHRIDELTGEAMKLVEGQAKYEALLQNLTESIIILVSGLTTTRG